VFQNTLVGTYIYFFFLPKFISQTIKFYYVKKWMYSYWFRYKSVQSLLEKCFVQPRIFFFLSTSTMLFGFYLFLFTDKKYHWVRFISSTCIMLDLLIINFIYQSILIVVSKNTNNFVKLIIQ